MGLDRHLVHRDLDHKEFKKILGYALFLAIFFAMVICYLRQSILLNGLENQINQKISLKKRLIKKNTELRTERGYLRSLSKIETDAKGRLGLVEPEQGQLIIFDYNRFLTGGLNEKRE